MSDVIGYVFPELMPSFPSIEESDFIEGDDEVDVLVEKINKQTLFLERYDGQGKKRKYFNPDILLKLRECRQRVEENRAPGFEDDLRLIDRAVEEYLEEAKELIASDPQKWRRKAEKLREYDPSYVIPETAKPGLAETRRRRALGQVEADKAAEIEMPEWKRAIWNAVFGALQLGQYAIRLGGLRERNEAAKKAHEKRYVKIDKAQVDGIEREKAFIGTALNDKQEALGKMSDAEFERFTKRFPKTRPFLSQFRTMCVEKTEISGWLDQYHEMRIGDAKQVWSGLPFAGWWKAFFTSQGPECGDAACLQEFVDSSRLPVDRHLIAHLLGTHFGRDSGLEGYNVEMLNRFVVQGLTRVQVRPEKEAARQEALQELNRGLKIYLDMNNSSLESFTGQLQTKGEALKEGEGIFVQTVWMNSDSGHAFILDISKQKNDQFTLKVFNSQPEYHAKGNKNGVFLHLPFVEIEEIESARLFSLPVWKAFQEMRSPDSNEKWKNYFIYEMILPTIGGKLSAKKYDAAQMQEVADVGFCSYLSFASYMQHHFSDTWPRWEFELQLKALVDLEAADTNRDGQLRNLLQKASEQMARSAERALQDGVINQKEFDFATRTISRIQSCASEMERAQVEAIQEKQKYHYAPAKDIHWGELDVGGVDLRRPIKVTGKEVDLLAMESWQFDSASFGQQIGALRERFKQANENQDYKIVKEAILQFSQKLPVEEIAAAASSLSKEEIEKAVVQLSEIGLDYLYALLMLERGDPARAPRPPREYLAMLKLITAADQLTRRAGFIFPNLLDNFMKQFLKGEISSSTFFHPTWDREFTALSQYWKTNSEWQKRVTPFFDFPEHELPQLVHSGSPFLKWLEEYAIGKGAEFFHQNRKDLTIELFTKAASRPDLVPPSLKAMFDLVFAGHNLRQMSTIPVRNEKISRDRGIEVTNGHLSLRLFGIHDWRVAGGKFFRYSSVLWDDRLLQAQDTIQQAHHLLYDSEDWHLNKRFRVSPKVRIRLFPNFESREFVNDFIIKDLGLQPMREMLALSAIPELQIRETFSYFQSKNFLLQETEYQILFKKLFFEPGILLEFLLKNQEESVKFVQSCRQFFAEQYVARREMGLIQPASFFLEVSHLFEEYVSDIGNRFPLMLFPSPSFDARRQMQELLALPHLSKSDRHHALLVYLSSFSHQRHLDEEQASSLLSCITQLDAFGLVDGGAFRQKNELVRDLLYRLRGPLERVIQGPRRDAILNQWVEEFFPDMALGSWKEEPNFPYYRSENGFIDVLEGKMILHDGLSTKPLPSEWRNNQRFVELTKASEETRTIAIDPSTYQFTTPKGEFIVRRDNEGWHYSRIIDGRLYNLIDAPKFLPSVLKKIPCWQSFDLPLEIRIGDEIKGELTTDHNEFEDNPVFSHLKTGLVLASNLDSDSLSPFLQVESSNEILAWIDPNTLLPQEVELPHLGLHFHFDADGLCHCQQFQGFRLAADQGIPALGGSKFHLVLENGSGKKLVLLPKVELGKNWKGSLRKSHTATRNERVQPLPYDLLANGMLKPRDLVSRLYLAYLCYFEQNYDQAIALLSGSAPSLRPYGEAEKEILTWMAKERIEIQLTANDDWDPRARAIRLKAAAMLLAQDEYYQITDNMDLSSQLDNYLIKEPHLAFKYHLTEEERQRLSRAYPPHFSLLIAERVEIPKAQYKPNALPSSYGIYRMDQIIVPDRQSLLASREFFRKAGHYYSLIKENSDKSLRAMHADLIGETQNISPARIRDEIEQALGMIARSNQRETIIASSQAALLLLAVLKDPDRFPSHFNEVEPEMVKTAYPGGERLFAEQSIYKRAARKEERTSLLQIAPPPAQPLLLASSSQPQSTRLTESLFMPTIKVKDMATAKEEALTVIDWSLASEAELKEKIVKLANREADDLFQSAVHQSRKQWGEEEPLQFDELLKFYLTRDTAPLQKRNSAIETAEARQIYQHIHAFLIHATHRQQLERIVKAMDAFQSGKLQREDLEKEAGRARAYNPMQRPDFLLFEYATGIRLRQEQIDNLAKLKDGAALEMIMGAGKTSVFLPLTALQEADGEHLSYFIMPEALLPSMAEMLEEKLGSAFGRAIDVFYFDRKKRLNTGDLERVYERFTRAIEQRRAVAMSGSSLQSLLLRAVEAILLEQPEAHRYRQIISLLREQGKLTLDEIDSLLDVLKSHHFTFGAPQKVNADELTVSVELFRLLPSLDQPISKERFINQIKPAIIDALLQGKSRNPEFNAFIAGALKEPIRRYLQGDPDPQAELYVERSPVKDLLAVMKEQLSEVLPLALSKQVNEHYGENPQPLPGQCKWMAIPYQGSRSPVLGSQHGTDLEIVDYTILLQLHRPIPREIVKNEIEAIKLRVDQERVVLPYIECLTLARFYEMAGSRKYSLYNLSPKEIEEIAQHIDQHSDIKLNLIQEHILPQLQTYARQMATNGQIYPLLASEVKGCSGTLWNSPTYPRHFRTIIPSITENYTVDLLAKDCPPPVIVSSRDELIQLARGKSIIDRAAVFRDVDNSIVAAKMGGESSSKGIVFYSSDDALMCQTKGKERPVSLASAGLARDEIAVFWDQKHTTGSDIPLSLNAEAIVTIGRHTTTRDLLQAVWRLRGLDRGQKVTFALLQEDADLISQDGPLSLQSCLDYCKRQESDRLKSDNVKAFRQKLQAALIARYMPILFDPTADLTDLEEAIEELFILKKPDSPFERYGRNHRPVSKEEWIRSELDSALNSKAFKILASRSSTTDLELELRLIAREEGEKLPPTIRAAHHLDLQVEIQSEKQTEQDKQLENETQKRTQTELHIGREQANRLTFDWGTEWSADLFTPKFEKMLKIIGAVPSIYWHNQVPVVTKVASLSPELDSFDEGLITSLAFSFMPIERPPFTPFQDVVQETLLIQDVKTGRVQMMLITQDEALHFEKNLREGKYQLDPEIRIALYHIDYGLYSPSPNFPTEEELHRDPRFLRLRTQAKFFDGRVIYSSQEIEILRAWMTEQTSLQSIQSEPPLKRLFTEKILLYKDDSLQKYPQSRLKKLFEDLSS